MLSAGAAVALLGGCTQSVTGVPTAGPSAGASAPATAGTTTAATAAGQKISACRGSWRNEALFRMGFSSR
jgi:hypothetical protein